MTTPIVQIKPVEWEVVRNDEGDKWHTFRSIFGSIDVFDDEDGCRWRWCFDEYYDEGQRDCESFDEGKAEAEQFYMERLSPAFESVGKSSSFDETAKALARAVLDGQMDAVAPFMDRLQEIMATA